MQQLSAGGMEEGATFHAFAPPIGATLYVFSWQWQRSERRKRKCASACVKFAAVPLAKAKGLAKPRVGEWCRRMLRKNMGTEDHGNLGPLMQSISHSGMA